MCYIRTKRGKFWASVWTQVKLSCDSWGGSQTTSYRWTDWLDIARALKVSIRGLPKDWRRLPGLPRHTWLCTLETDLEPLNRWRPLSPYGYSCKATLCQTGLSRQLIFNIRTLSSRMSKITNDVLTRSGTGCFTAVPIMATVGVKGLTLASTHHGNTLRIENTGSTSWKPLRSSSSHTRDDDETDR